MATTLNLTAKNVLSQAQFDALEQAGTLTDGEYNIKGTPVEEGADISTNKVESATLVGGSAVEFAEFRPSSQQGGDNQWHIAGSVGFDSAAKFEDNIYIAGIENIKKSGTQVSLFWHGTQAQYDALGTYNSDTLYIIVG